MSSGGYSRRRRNSLCYAVYDFVHIAAAFGPVGAMAAGAIGFAFVYAILPIGLMAWTDATKAKLAGQTLAAFANLLDQVIWHRVIGPCQWVGLAILLA